MQLTWSSLWAKNWFLWQANGKRWQERENCWEINEMLVLCEHMQNSREKSGLKWERSARKVSLRRGTSVGGGGGWEHSEKKKEVCLAKRRRRPLWGSCAFVPTAARETLEHSRPLWHSQTQSIPRDAKRFESWQLHFQISKSSSCVYQF